MHGCRSEPGGQAAGAPPDHGTQAKHRAGVRQAITKHFRATQTLTHKANTRSALEGGGRKAERRREQGAHGREGPLASRPQPGAEAAGDNNGEGHRQKQTKQELLFRLKVQEGELAAARATDRGKGPTPDGRHRPGLGAQSAGHSGSPS